MTEAKHFEHLESPLKGTNLLEASAGTGKTYTIAGLFLRLVLEQSLSVNEILVVTFTEAATDELKDRIRGKLREALGVFSGRPTEEPFLRGLFERHPHANTAITLIREALRAFDQAAIFTIHGFCRRVLYECAFESGSLFDTELVTNQENLVREFVEDFWRRHLYTASPLFVDYALGNHLSPEGLFAFLAPLRAQLHMRIIPEVEMPATTPEPEEEEKAFLASCRKLRRAWASAHPAIEEILTTHRGLNRNKYRTENIPFLISAMHEYVASEGNHPLLFSGFDKFTAGQLAGAVKKDHAPPDHPFFELCEELKNRQTELLAIFEQRLLGMKVRLFRELPDELTRRKADLNMQSFDDLLLKLHRALEGEGGARLAAAVRRKFRAALIDEFQDTDSVQYAIFRKIFGDGDCALFLIGDPKQAVYGFRGADIFAYMEAARDVQSNYTLGENWRSTPELVAAVNAIFARARRPFVYDEIPFRPARAAKRKDGEYLRMERRTLPPLELWFVNAGRTTGSDKPLGKTQAREIIREAVADEIAGLLDLSRKEKIVLGERALKESDLAVLVRRNREAQAMQETLSRRGIPSVLYSTANLFDAPEAAEVEKVLAAIAGPTHERLLKAALTTPLLGIRGEELSGLLADERAWEEWLIRFKRYHELWRERGFIQMFRHFLLEEEVLIRLMSLPNGERRNTNLLHLSEVLQQASIDRKLGMGGLLKWLAEQQDPTTPRLDEHQLRLESDENAVKLITIHKSKGLEYPVVFCPFTWDGSRIKKPGDPILFHDRKAHMQLTLDLGSPEIGENRVSAEKELLAENLRLFYVALTRAKSRCYLVWGRFNEAATSAPAYLLHQPESSPEGSLIKSTAERFSGLSDEDVLAELEMLVSKAGGTIRLSEMSQKPEEAYVPLPAHRPHLSAREFSGHIDHQWRISSFSSLVAGRTHGEEMPDRDAIGFFEEEEVPELGEPAVEEIAEGMFSFPKGTKAGTCLHDIFEHLDFASSDPSHMEELVAAKLLEYGFELTWQETLCEMLRNTLKAPLDPRRADFRLSQLRNQDRLNELEFYFPLKTVFPEKIKRIFDARWGATAGEDFPQAIERLEFTPTKGFMRGFIDLVFRFGKRFYLVDWKSNFLGHRTEDYGREALALVMKREYYFLQYTIYTLALDQYLRRRLPDYRYEYHFGGIFYIFLRGVDPEKGPEYGIYRDLPPPQLIRALREELVDAGPSSEA